MKKHIAKCWKRAHTTNGKQGMSVQVARKMLAFGLNWLRKGKYRITNDEKCELIQDVLELDRPTSIDKLTVEQCRLAIVRLIARGWVNTEKGWVTKSVAR